MSDRVTQWLEQLGLGQYAEAFEENAIEAEHLEELDHETLKEIGVRSAQLIIGLDLDSDGIDREGGGRSRDTSTINPHPF